MRNVLLLSALAQALLLGSFGGGPQPVTALAKEADLVVLATDVADQAGDSQGPSGLTLRIHDTLKGQAATQLRAALPVPAVDERNGTLAASLRTAIWKGLAGQEGLWFLKLRPSGEYHILPISTEPLAGPEDFFFPLKHEAAATISSGLTLNQRLLRLVVMWYRQDPSPGLSADTQLQASFFKESPKLADVSVEDLLSAAADLSASPSLPHHAMGLAIEIQLGSDRALSQTIQEVDQLKESGKFRFVTTAIGFYSHGPTAIPILSRAVELHSTATGFDDAIASALSRMIIGNRTVVPAMARLLESADSTAALRAASFFSTYALLCDAHGNVREGEPDGPFATEETRAYRPGYDPNLRAEDCVRFWQHWWKANAAKLGFSAG